MSKRRPDAPTKENPEVTLQQFKESRPALEVLAAYGVAARRRGPQKAPKLLSVNIRLDPGTLSRYRQTGRGWQGRMRTALAKASKRLPAATR
jgi:uncharacterized protein (DUF4415 family)